MLIRYAVLAMEVPTPETVDAWDDASLFAATGSGAASRAQRSGFDSLNEAERVLCCAFELDNEVNNGGFGQWLFNCDPRMIGHTGWACQRIGADSTVRLIEAVLAPLQNPLTFKDIDAWRDYLGGLPEEKHDAFEAHSTPFASVEPELLARSYDFARHRWADVRTA